VATRIPPGHAKRGASAQAPGQVNRTGLQNGLNTGRIPTLQVPGGGQQQQLGNLAQPAQALSNAGLVQQGVNPTGVLQEIVNNLRGLGYTPNQGQDLAGQLREALTQMQERAGLRTTGQLDSKTLDTLVKLGALREPRHTTTDKPPRDGFEKTGGRAVLSFLGGLFRGLGGARGKGGGDAQPGKDAAASKEAAAQAKPEPLPVRRGIQTTRGAAQAAKAAEPARPQSAEPRATQSVQERTAQPVQSRAQAEVRPQAEARPLAEARPQAGADNSAGRAQSQSSTLGQSATSPPTLEQARTATTAAQQDPTAKGLPEAKGDPRAVQGQGQTQGEAAARYDIGATHAGSIRESQGTDGDYHEYEEGATERDHGGASSGEEHSNDAERGHAQLNDGSEAGPGHYKVPALSWQIAQALRSITRDPDESNRATTYSWDVTLFKPAIYGAGQKAAQLFHLVVVSADPFDPVWERAREELTRHLLRLEPQATLPEVEDFQSALRRARVSEAPATLESAPPDQGEEP